MQLSLFHFRILLDIHSKESPFFHLFGRDPLTHLWKLLSPKIRHLGDKKVSLIFKQSDMPLALARKIICLNRQKSNKDHTPTTSPDKFKVSNLVYIKNNATSTEDPKWESGFHLIKFLTPAVLFWRTL